jgi:aminoglycoside phosphotransferase (APT) family kinase protein
MGRRRPRRFGRLADFEPVVRAAFGHRRRLAEVRPLRGASKKGVYQLIFDDGSAVVGYVWGETENYWPVAGNGAHSLLRSLGIRVPELYLLDRSGTLYPDDVALIEWVPGRSLESMLDNGVPEALQVLGRLRETLELMREHRGPGFGKIAHVAAGTSVGGSCEHVVLDRALAHLAEAAGRMPSIAAARSGFDETLREFAAAIEPRQEYGLVHGELGPDHVLVDGADEPVLIDIEGLMYFDVEWEHAFLWMRFKDRYPLLRADSLDENRLRLYRLALHLSLAAVPMRLAYSDYPERDFMIEIAVGHARRALGYLQPP